VEYLETFWDAQIIPNARKLLTYNNDARTANNVFTIGDIDENSRVITNFKSVLVRYG